MSEQSPNVYYVSGVCCSTEEAIVRKRMDALAGEGGYRFNPVTCRLSVTGDVPAQRVIRDLQQAGFRVRPAQDFQDSAPFMERHATALLTGLAAVLGIVGIFLDLSGASETASRILLGASIAVGGFKIFQKAWGAARSRVLDMNFLMSVAVIGALAIDRWSEGAAVIVLFSVSLMLESYSVSRSRRAIQSLMSLSPSHATVLRNGQEMSIHAAGVGIGEILVVRPGDRIPLDGIVVEGESTVDESPITGESAPVSKTPEESVFAGSINGNGAMQVSVTKVYEETTIAHIVHLVEEAQNKRAPVQHLVDRFARVYTPVVLGIALLVMTVPPLAFGAPFADWLYRALVLIVIACPCALVISTPITIVSALANAARQGILIKGGRHLETLAAVQTIAFDKTGTLTEGKPGVTDVLLLNSLSRERVLGIIAAIEQKSEHHLASAIVSEAIRNAVPLDDIAVERFEALPGRGVKASIEGKTYYFGNHELCHEQGYCSAAVEESIERLALNGKTAMVLGADREALAIVAVADDMRPQALQMMKNLRGLGIRHIVMLTGDHGHVAQRLADGLEIERLHAGALPQHKVESIEELKRRHGTVAMVGDGINDAPALAAASVGIAMGVSGTDAALETADVVLMSDNIGRIPFLFGLSRKALSIIKQNIAIALSLKLLFLALTLTGTATLWMAVLADDGAALLVVLNGLRALSWRE